MKRNFIGIPDKIRQSTSVHEVIINTLDLNDNVGRTLFFGIAEATQSTIDIIGANRLGDAVFYAAYFSIFGNEVPDEVLILRATIEDPEDLPYEIKDGDSAFVILFDEIYEFESMSEAINSIEESFALYPRLEIKDFCVLTGRKLGGKFKTKFKEKVTEAMQDLDKQKERIYASGIL